MADDDTTQDAAPETGAAENDSPSIPPEVEKALRKANKEAETLRLKLKSFEDRDKTELQRAVERAEEAERKAAQSELRGTRSEIARETGVPPRFVVGDTEDDMRAAAKEYLEDREQSAKDRARKSEVDQGVRGAEAASKKPDINTLIRAAAGRS